MDDFAKVGAFENALETSMNTGRTVYRRKYSAQNVQNSNK
jgi:hypothetical protein